MMTEQKSHFEDRNSDRFSARMSVFAWVICAALGWALALSSFSTLTGNDDGTIMAAQNEPSAEEAARMEQVLPAAGESSENPE